MADPNSPAPGAPLATPERPWLGLARFTEAERGYFFGRDAELEELRDRVLRAPLTVFYGVSGYGKSSLLGAGLVPALRDEGYLPAPLQRFLFNDRSHPPQAQALDAIIQALPSVDGFDPATLDRSRTLWEFFHDRSLPWWRTEGGEPVQPVLIFDQFEDFFTLGEDRGEECAEQARSFLTELADLIENRPPAALREKLKADRGIVRAYDFQSRPVKIVIALREDFLSRLERWRRLMPSVAENRFELRLLSGSQALRAIAEPARKQAGKPPIVDEATAAAVVRFVAGADAETPLDAIDNVPPLLSLICAELNERRLTAGQEQIPIEWVRASVSPGASGTSGAGGRTAAEEVLARFYSDSFSGHPAAVRYFVEDKLVSEAGFRETITLDSAIADLSRHGVEDPASNLRHLVDQRLLIMEDRGGIARIEVTHDILASLALRSRRERLDREQAARRSLELAEAKRKARARAVFASALVALTVCALAGAWAGLREAGAAKTEARRADKEAARAREQAAALKEADEKSRRQLHEASMEDYSIANQRLEKGEFGLAVAHLARALDWEPCNDQASVRLYEAIASHVRAMSSPLRHLFARSTSAVASPDGSVVLTLNANSTAQLWDATSFKPLGEPLAHEAPPSTAAFSPDGKRFLTLCKDTVRIWGTASRKPAGEPLKLGSAGRKAIFSPDGSRILTTEMGKATVRLWDSVTSQPIGEPCEMGGAVLSSSISVDGASILISSAAGEARILDGQTLKQTGELPKQTQPAMDASYSPDGTRILTRSLLDGIVRLWDAATLAPIGEPLTLGTVLSMARFSPDGSLIVTAGRDRAVRLWDAATFKEAGEPLHHESSVYTAVFSDDARWLVTTGFDGTARIWNVTTRKQVGDGLFHNGVTTAFFSQDGSKLFTTGEGGVRAWDAASGLLAGDPLRHGNSVQSAVFSPDSSRILTASWDSTARLWDAATLKPIGKPLAHPTMVNSAEFSPDGKQIVTASERIRVWDATTLELVAQGEPGAMLNMAAYNRDGTKIVTAGGDKTARVWDSTTLKAIGGPLLHGDSVHTAIFSPDGSRILTASDDGNARLWDAVTLQSSGNPIEPARGAGVEGASFRIDGKRIATASATGRVWDAATLLPIGEAMASGEGYMYRTIFSPDGALLLTASSDHTARLWRSDGAPVGRALLHDDVVQNAAFSPDGTRMLTASWDRSARVWENYASYAHIPPAPAWVKAWARGIGGRRFDADGNARQVDAAERIAAMNHDREGSDPWTALARWVQEDRRSGTTRPGGAVRCREIAERERDANTKTSLESALGYDPSVPLARLLLAAFETNLQRAAFLRSFDLKRMPDDAGLWARASYALIAQGQGAQAITAAQTALHFDAKSRRGMHALAAAYSAAKQTDRALETYQAALGLADATGADYNEAGYYAGTIGKLDRVREIFQRAKAKHPLSELQNEGWALLDAGAPRDALQAFLATQSALKPGETPNALLVAGLAASHWLAGEKDEALKEYERLVALAPRFATPGHIAKLQSWTETEKQPLIEVQAEYLRRNAKPDAASHP